MAGTDARAAIRAGKVTSAGTDSDVASDPLLQRKHGFYTDAVEGRQSASKVAVTDARASLSGHGQGSSNAFACWLSSAIPCKGF